VLREPGDERDILPDIDDVSLTRLDEVQPKPIDWLWTARVPKGKLSLLVGDPGVGKSWIGLDVAARVSRGAEWPDGGIAPTGDVVILSAEDGLDDTIRPRLDLLGADVTRIHALTAIHERVNTDNRTAANLVEAARAVGAEIPTVTRSPLLTRDVERLERVILATGAVLLIVDPVSAYLGDTDSHRDADVRGVLAPLAAVADKTGAAIVGIMHLRKTAGGPAIHRAIGSIAFVAAARLVLAVAPDPEDDTRRLIVPAKSNICAPAAALAYRLVDGKLAWETEPVTGITADALLSRPEDRVARDHETDAARLMRELIADTTAWPMDADHAYTLARETGIAATTIRSTARRLGVRTRRVGFGRGGKWTWERPIDASAPRTSTAMASITPMASTRERIEAIDTKETIGVRDNNNDAYGREGTS
jgi:hypothetical protein